MKEQIADRDERPLEPAPLDAKYRAEAHCRRKEQIDQLVHLPLHPRQIRQPRDGKHHIENPEEGQQDGKRQRPPDNPRQCRLNALKPRYTDVPYTKKKRRCEHGHEKQHPDKEAFFRARRESDGLFLTSRLAIHRQGLAAHGENLAPTVSAQPFKKAFAAIIFFPGA